MKQGSSAVLMVSFVLMRYLEEMKYIICTKIYDMYRTDKEFNLIFKHDLII